jgi:hypothetical protein
MAALVHMVLLRLLAVLSRCCLLVLQGLELFQRVGEVAEAEGHHPDLHLMVSRILAWLYNDNLAKGMYSQYIITVHSHRSTFLCVVTPVSKSSKLPVESKSSSIGGTESPK